METSVRYPRNLNINFRKLDKAALTKILRHYRVELPKEDLSQADLAIMVAKVFDVTMVLEQEVVNAVADKRCYSGADSNVSKKKLAMSNGNNSHRENLDREPASPGEQVAAKVKSNEDGSWILGNVLEYNPSTMRYLVQDEDEVSRVIQLSYDDVRRLDDSSANLRRGDSVLAVFPETTSFYRAVVVKTPKMPNNVSSGNWEVIVKFEDDEDEQGRNPARRVPARFVLRRSDVEDSNDESDDED